MSNPTQDQHVDLTCLDIVKNFNEFVAVDKVSLEIPSGSFFSILGPSGCGKTTLMRMIAGFLEPTSGEIQIKGRSMNNVPPNKRPVSMVFQHLALFPMMNVAENIAYGLKRQKLAKADIEFRVKDALMRVGLPDAGPKQVNQLSGGQKQRVAIARCMVLDPDVLLLDEPLGALDLKLREHMKVELKHLQHQFNTTFVYITHDQSEALMMSDRVAVMNNGRFEQVGDPQELYYNPQTAFVAGFVGDSNRWMGTIQQQDSTGIKVETKDGLTFLASATGDAKLNTGDSVEIFVRPESVILTRGEAIKSDNNLTGKVDSLLFNGANSRVIVCDDKSGDEITVTLPQTGEFSDLKIGETLNLSWRLSQAKCFLAPGGKPTATGVE